MRHRPLPVDRSNLHPRPPTHTHHTISLHQYFCGLDSLLASKTSLRVRSRSWSLFPSTTINTTPRRRISLATQCLHHTHNTHLCCVCVCAWRALMLHGETTTGAFSLRCLNLNLTGCSMNSIAFFTPPANLQCRVRFP